MSLVVSQEEYISPGHMACPGCGATLAMRYVLKGLGKETIIVLPASCWSVIDGVFPYSSVKVPLFHTAFETAASVASGIKAALEVQGDTETTVLAFAGDGATFDIGLQALSGAAERNEDFIYVCYDNEAYMNTGIQRSSATPYGAWTTTTPVRHPKDRPKKRILEIIAAHEIPYAATASIGYPDDLIAKVTKAKGISGTRFIHVFSPCPTGWKSEASLSIKIARLAVHTKVFPLYEVENGFTFHINMEPKNLPVEEYLKLQERFAHLAEQEIAFIQKNVDEEWEHLLKRALY
ncbi:MAG: 3-methyl-2-oxobutanoate dehydrogenase subunit beta [Thermodesulfobacteriota bacterium]